MKRLKFVLMSFVLLLCNLALPVFRVISKLPSNIANAIPVTEEIFDYISLSEESEDGEEHELDMNSFQTYTEGEDTTSYIVTNNAITINLKPFEYAYNNIEFESERFRVNQFKKTFTKTREGFEDNHIGTFGGRDFYIGYYNSNIAIFDIDTQNEGVAIPLLVANTSSAISAVDNDDTVDLTVNMSYTFLIKSTYNSGNFSFTIGTLNQSGTRSFEFIIPTVEFANAKNPIASFTTTKAGELEDKTDTTNYLMPENTFKKVQFKLISNEFDEKNPLYFDINYNGFDYTFKLYVKNIIDDDEGAKDFLFVEYYDELKQENDMDLATIVNNVQGVDYIDRKTLKLNSDDTNEFNILFENTGRYQVTIYDSTYKCNMSYPNFYSTSFYIEEETENPTDNIYMIAQSPGSDGNLEYIVGNSTQNRDVILTIKNLEKALESLNRITITKSIFTGDELPNPDVTTYTRANFDQLREQIKNGDLTFDTFTDDARYAIRIYDDNSGIPKIEYIFTIIKEVKSGYDPEVIDPETGEPFGYHAATSLYSRETINYPNRIDSTMVIKINVVSDKKLDTTTEYDNEFEEVKLKKNYQNDFSISYAIKRANVSITEEKSDNLTAMILTFMGVGDIKAYITFNGETTDYNFNYEDGNATLYLTEYGVYNISMVDEMGATYSIEYEYKQGINASTIILIVLSSIVVIVVLAFIFRARGTVKTR